MTSTDTGRAPDRRRGESVGPVSETAVRAVVHQLRMTTEREVPSRRIGEFVMTELRKLDKVAYVRFASVYKNFREASDFKALLGTLSDPAALPADTGSGEPRGAGGTATGDRLPDLSATVTPLRPKRQPKSRA